MREIKINSKIRIKLDIPFNKKQMIIIEDDDLEGNLFLKRDDAFKLAYALMSLASEL